MGKRSSLSSVLTRAGTVLGVGPTVAPSVARMLLPRKCSGTTIIFDPLVDTNRTSTGLTGDSLRQGRYRSLTGLGLYQWSIAERCHEASTCGTSAQRRMTC